MLEYNKQLSSNMHGMNLKQQLCDFKTEEHENGEWGRVFIDVGVPLLVLSVHCVQFVSVTSPVARSLRAAMSMSSDECVSETECISVS
jgi:hypothetical protein